MYEAVSPYCWRCGVDSGTMTHIWWACPRIRPLWEEAQNTLQAIGITDPPLDIHTGLFLSYPRPTPVPTKRIMTIAALVARNLIASQWKQPHCPSKLQLLSKIQQYYIYERMSTKTTAQSKHFQTSWIPWVEYWDTHTSHIPPHGRPSRT
ncbi:Hypothetical predicted protein [Pelobates cultripes]|uniref:Reverse transcriptase zinc-binding domain-containing protein n=1 Tax=Pelobates cultripes TaxID=61616 RepID=A0AAD1VLN5_PELCU|nr:Hypothetical predicted protein [Pelobates cultripes]